MKFYFSLLFVLFTSFASFSQSRKLWIEEGDKCFKKQDYSTAIAWYLKALDDTSVVKGSSVLPYSVSVVNQKFKTDSVKKSKPDTLKSTSKKGGKKSALKISDPEQYTLLQIGHAYRLNAEFSNAIDAYKKALNKQAPDARYYYALTLMNVRDYQEALNEFDKYITSGHASDSLSAWAQKREAACYFSLDSTKIVKTISVEKLDTVINGGNSSFAATYFGDPQRLLITSARKENTVKDPKKEDPEYLCDIYIVEMNDNSARSVTNLGAPINTNVHEGAAFVNDKAIYFTRWDDNKPNEATIWKANKQSDRFFQPQMLHNGINQKGFKSTHPFVSADGRKFFFSSNKPGGKGGMDIWMCDINENGDIGEARNISQPVNTAGDEVTPFLHTPSGMLYFSSNGHIGMGGLDIFRAEYNAFDNVFALPVNMNAPVNSSKDDSYFIMEKSGLSGYLTSDREDCPGGNCYKLYNYKSMPVTFDVSGVVFDGNTNEPMPNALVTIRNVHDDEDVYYIMSNDKGEYSQKLKANSEYFMKAQKNKFFGDAATHSSKDKIVTTHFDQDFFLSKIPEGEIEIQGIEYDFNSAALRPVSMQSLDKIADLLNVNDNLTIDVEANTDSRGNDSYNMKLSQARAQSCVDYLVSKGVSNSRIKAKGNGETVPLIKDAEINKMKPKSPEWEAAHQKNRRTALRIVGESEIKIINKGK
jgi:OmpA-OmpF porin, OOP family